MWTLASDIITSGFAEGRRSLHEQLDVDACVILTQEYCGCALGTSIDREMLVQLVSTFAVAGIFQPSEFLARTMCISPAMVEVIGITLARRLQIFMYEEIFGIEVQHLQSARQQKTDLRFD